MHSGNDNFRSASQGSAKSGLQSLTVGGGGSFFAAVNPICVRLVFALLFAVGAVFASLSWMLVCIAFHRCDDITVLLGCGLSLSGYFLWVNWFWFAVRGRFLPNSWLTIQTISVLNHIGWLVFFYSVKRGRGFLEVINELGPVSDWILLNLVLAVVFVVFAPTIKGRATEVVM